jgi:adenosylcobinamide kinase/adenosylcobinamide-phosphate guanylyltransferase
MKTLVLGGVRSGKSRYAEAQAAASGFEVVYLATALVGDEEMRTRIDAHRRRRPPLWQTVEEPLHLALALQEHARADRCIVVDCLTLWLTNLLCRAPDRLADEVSALVRALPDLPGTVLFVSNETNLGVIPMDALTRRFCDEAGVLHQTLAALCDRVVLMIAGLPQILKETKR